MKILVIVKGYPRLSETFIHRELLAFEQNGHELTIFALKRPTDHVSFEKALDAKIKYRPRGMFSNLHRVYFYLSFLWNWKKNLELLQLAKTGHSKSLKYLSWANWLARFGQLRKFDLVYAHFSHDPSEVGYFLKSLIDKPFYISAHAKDVYINHEKSYYRKIIAGASKVFTCHQKCYELLNPLHDSCYLHPHGIEKMEQIEVLSWSHKKAQKGQIDFIYFGRLVAKKGIEFSLEVIAELQRLGLNVHFHIYGSGEEGSSLEEKTKALSIEEYVSFYGAYQRLDILNLLAREQFIFLGGFRALENNDQDGIPNTLLECMSMGCPVVTTDSGSISQLMSSDREALIIPRDKHAAAKMMIELLSNSQELERMVEFARKNTLENFSFEENFKKLLEHF